METLAEAMARVKESTNLREWCDGNLQRMGRTYVCPGCGSGMGKNHTPAFSIMSGGQRWKCFSCNRMGDVFDLAGLVHGIEDKGEQLEAVAAWAGVDGRGAESRFKASEHKHATSNPKSDAAGPEKADSHAYEQGRARHRDYIRAMRENLRDADALAYLQGRGITWEQALEWGLGYDPDRRRIIIPWEGTDYYHVDRSIDQAEGSGKYNKPKNDEVGRQPMWNPAALQAPAFFVVEGAMDALAVRSCGYEAVALGSTASVDLVEQLRRASEPGVAVLMLDHDEPDDRGRTPGQEGQEKLAEALASAGVDYVSADTGELGAKDAGELFARDRDALAAFLYRWHEQAVAHRQERQEEAYTEALAALRVLDPLQVAGDVLLLKNAQEPIPTGLGDVDDALGGGLPSRGLVTLGAVSSVGKTTLVLQVADNIAAAGRTCLFVTIEQSAEELVAKTLSRLLAQYARSNGGRMRASAQALMSRQERERWEREDPEKARALDMACRAYGRIAIREDGRQTLHVMEATRQPTVLDIRQAAEHIARHDGEPPVVFIDYLQLLAAEEGHDRDSDKQVVDRNMLALRQMARELNTCVLVISSLNRAAYNGSIDLASFKESGSVEYSSDVLLGLQPEKMEEETEGLPEAKAKEQARKTMRDFKADEVRSCELVVLKNRNGGLPRYGVPLQYDALTNTFTEG